MSDDHGELVAHLNGLPRPTCAELTPFVVSDARHDPAYVQVVFAPQPAFRNHFDHVQGGFAVAMVDVVLSLTVYVAVQEFLPTISITSHFLAPLPLGEARGEGRVLRRGSTVTFVEAGLWSADGRLCVQASGSSVVRA